MEPFHKAFSIQGFDPRDPAFLDNRYACYRRFRETSPIMRTQVRGGLPTWYLYRYADVTAVLKDKHFVTNFETVYPGQHVVQFPPKFASLNRVLKEWLLFRDPPFHTRVRAHVNKVFTPERVEYLKGRISAIARSLLDNVPAGRPVDLMPSFAWPLPVDVICDLLGVEPAFRARLREISRLLAGAVGGGLRPEMLPRANEGCAELEAYFNQVVDARRREPVDDLVGTLSATMDTTEGLSRNELISMCILLMFAGHETSVNLIGNGMLALLRNPEQLETLKANPGLMDNAVEELLRYDAPVQVVFRIAAEDTLLAGETIRKGERLGVVLGAANHDPAQFPDPDRLDISREPGRIVSFGSGIHFCLGALLGRAEGQLAIGALLERFPRIQLAAEPPRWRPNLVFAGLASLPVVPG